MKTVVNHPRRLEELLRILEDKDRSVRGKAAAALARLAESHPTRLMRVVLRLREALADDSANVRWHLVYTLGKLGSRFPGQSRIFLGDIVARLDDQNRIVRSVACKAISQVAVRKPMIIEEYFQNLKKEIPPTVARVMRHARSRR